MKLPNSSIASLYIEQTNFKGVGINIHKDVVPDVEQTEFHLADCVYVASKNENQIKTYFPVKYKDIAYDPKDIWEKTDGIKGVLNNFYTTFYSAYVKSPKFGAYYIPAFINLIRSYTDCDFAWEPSNDGGKIVTSSVVFNSVMQMLEKKSSDLADLPGLDYLALTLLDVIYNLSN